MQLKNWVDTTFFITKEEVEEGYEVDNSNYWWIFLYIIFGLFTMFIGLQALVFMQ